MEYRYTNEESITTSLNITLGEVDALIELLQPIAEDDSNKERRKASWLLAGLTDVRAKTIENAASWIGYRKTTLMV